MKKILTALMFLLPTTAVAQTVEGTAQAANNVTVVADAGRYAPADTSVKYSGHTYTTPSVGGSYFGGANPCLVGTGGGAGMVATMTCGRSFASRANLNMEYFCDSFTSSHR